MQSVLQNTGIVVMLGKAISESMSVGLPEKIVPKVTLVFPVYAASKIAQTA